MQACLAEGFPFVFAVYESFESPAVERTGKVGMPSAGERTLGGHAVWQSGIHVPTGDFSSGTRGGRIGGREGNCTMPFQYLEERNLSDDSWTFRKGENI
jgi:hypothetical protein